LCRSQLARSRRCAHDSFRFARATPTPTRTVRALGAPGRAAGSLDRPSRDPCPGNYRRPSRKCLTTIDSALLADDLRRLPFAAPFTSPDVEHVRTGGPRPRVRSPILNSPLVVCSCDVTSAELITESDCASVPRPGANPTGHQRSDHHAATAVRLSEVDASGDALSAPIHCEQQRHRRALDAEAATLLSEA
jgi:hypothetical protein